MRFRFFTVPALDPDAAQDALNAFCAQHRIVASNRHFVDRGIDSFWEICVTWVEGAASLVAVGAISFARRASCKSRSVAKLCGRRNAPLKARAVGSWEAA
ncbi:MAG: hypothetical protein L6Q69_14650 [Zoogloea sp.]|nr:hypothetical protein [Zoogloea sp.]